MSRIPLPDKFDPEIVGKALDWIDQGKHHSFHASTDYDLINDGKFYPPKAVAGVAAQLITGQQYRPSDFSGGVDSKCFRLLEDAGYRILPRHPIEIEIEASFVPGRFYNRQRDISKVYGGQQRGGISTPKNAPYVFLFSGQTGQAYGYEDKFQPDGSFWYTGEGQVGDMAFIRGNLAIAEHERNGKRLLLFEVPKKGVIRYTGEARMIQYHREQRPDRDGNMRSAIVFELEIISAGNNGTGKETEIISPASYSESKYWSMSYKKLCELASKPSPKTANRKEQKRIVQHRSEAVRIFVLRRAQGCCELCGEPAPFNNKKNKPYLEPHHMTRLADGGPDLPEFVAALCPNCHREIHFGKNGDELNKKLQKKILKLMKKE